MGRRAKPVELKRLTGNPGQRRLPSAIVIMPPDGKAVPPVPRHLHLKARGRRVWHQLWTYAAPWLSPASNVEMVGRLCRAYEEYDELIDRLDEGEWTLQGKMGQPVTNPLWRMKEDVEARITRYESYCGLTPSDMQRFYDKILPLAEQDPMEALRVRQA